MNNKMNIYAIWLALICGLLALAILDFFQKNKSQVEEELIYTGPTTVEQMNVEYGIKEGEFLLPGNKTKSVGGGMIENIATGERFRQACSFNMESGQ